jgi:hypothetical protein
MHSAGGGLVGRVVWQRLNAPSGVRIRYRDSGRGDRDRDRLHRDLVRHGAIISSWEAAGRPTCEVSSVVPGTVLVERPEALRQSRASLPVARVGPAIGAADLTGVRTLPLEPHDCFACEGGVIPANATATGLTRVGVDARARKKDPLSGRQRRYSFGHTSRSRYRRSMTAWPAEWSRGRRRSRCPGCPIGVACAVTRLGATGC